MKKEKQNKGITLVALVITIIVMLILAGITINLTIGEDGILKRAEKAGEIYKNSEVNELLYLKDFEASVIAGKIARIEDGIQYVGDGMGNLIPVPVGFSYLEGTKNSGFVIKNDKDGNEFVWIPVDDTTPYCYERVAFSKEGWDLSQTKGEYDSISLSYKITHDSATYYFTEKIPSIQEDRTELDSIIQYGGYYIGRYESGIKEYISVNKEHENNITEYTGYIGGKVTIQKGQQVWNYITRDKAKAISEELYNKEENNIISRLCSSYAWDTALKFLETENSTYITNSEQGNYKEAKFTYIDLEGKIKTKQSGESTLLPTGQTISIKNIYDMGGNVNEWTTESYSKSGMPYVRRGGDYSNNKIQTPACRRSYGDNDLYAYNGFRIVLFM